MRAINLLPPEAALRVKARRRRVVWILAGLAYIALLAVLTIWWQGRVDSAREDLAQQEQVNQAVQAEMATFAGATDLQAQFDASVVSLTQALQTDINWGRFLNDLGRLIPDRVWLTSFSAAASVDPETFTFGSAQVSGVAFDYPDVASWLRAVDESRFPGLTAAWVPSAAEGTIGEARTITFSSSVALTAEALSSRLLERIPVVNP
ncbi:MAG: PilN domain-containing protein [Acidimicrobiia bacterium]|nr:PilN domain-containing protein [Acidimicrobiia bacterium]